MQTILNLSFFAVGERIRIKKVLSRFSGMQDLVGSTGTIREEALPGIFAIHIDGWRDRMGSYLYLRESELEKE